MVPWSNDGLISFLVGTYIRGGYRRNKCTFIAEHARCKGTLGRGEMMEGERDRETERQRASHTHNTMLLQFLYFFPLYIALLSIRVENQVPIARDLISPGISASSGFVWFYCKIYRLKYSGVSFLSRHWGEQHQFHWRLWSDKLERHAKQSDNITGYTSADSRRRCFLRSRYLAA